MKQTGRHPDKALTSAKVRNLTEPGRLTDGSELYLIVDPSGAKRWLQRVVVNGKRADIGLGSHRLVSLDETLDEAVRTPKDRVGRW